MTEVYQTVRANGSPLAVTFGADGKSFKIDVTAGMTLDQLRQAINSKKDNWQHKKKRRRKRTLYRYSFARYRSRSVFPCHGTQYS